MNIKIKVIGMITCSLLFVAFLLSCSSIPKQTGKPVTNFQAEKYLGNWYEIARFDFNWEKNLENVTTTYSMNENGTIKVVNSGYDYISQKEKQSVGKAKFVDSKNVGALKVSFFGPFYSDYTVIAIDSDYQYALVAGENANLLWILSRTPTIPDDVKYKYIQIAKDSGYDLTNLVWTTQN